MNKENFAKGRIPVPLPVVADAYTISSECIASDQAKKSSIYNFTNRISPIKAFPDVAQDSRMLLYGLSDFIRIHLTKQITSEDVDKSVHFMKDAHSFGGELPFDERPWRKIVKDFNGYLPIKIEALPEGSVWFPNEPVIQVYGEDGFGEIAASIEAVGVGLISIASARLTLCRHWLERIKEWCKLDNNEAAAQFMIHDFGMRASSCPEESEILGRAHLLVFHGTDTFNAAYQARVMGAKPPTGTSILALAHRIVQGHKTERDAYEKLLGAGPIGSYVADCYNYKKALEEILIPLAKANPDKTIVSRPDSGDFLENTRFLFNKALEYGLVVAKTSPEASYEPANLKEIQGDSMTPRKVEAVFRERKKNGFAPTKWGGFGVGGYLRNIANRDILSSAYKLCCVDGTPVIKLSDTPAKLSVPGPCVIRRFIGNGFGSKKTTLRRTVYLLNEFHTVGEPAYQIFYDGTKTGLDKFGDVCIEEFPVLQDRVINGFNLYESFCQTNPHFGLRNSPCLSEKIVEMQDAFYRVHK